MVFQNVTHSFTVSVMIFAGTRYAVSGLFNISPIARSAQNASVHLPPVPHLPLVAPVELLTTVTILIIEAIPLGTTFANFLPHPRFGMFNFQETSNNKVQPLDFGWRQQKEALPHPSSHFYRLTPNSYRLHVAFADHRAQIIQHRYHNRNRQHCHTRVTVA